MNNKYYREENMYEFPKEVTFHPWVGSHYEDSDNHFGFRLLVLGESHYNDAMNENDQDPEWLEYSNSHGGKSAFTQFVVHKWGQNQRASFFTIIAKVLRGTAEWIDDDTRSEIWEHVTFYNYVSSYVPWYHGDEDQNAPHLHSAFIEGPIRDGATKFETRCCPHAWQKHCRIGWYSNIIMEIPGCIMFINMKTSIS